MPKRFPKTRLRSEELLQDESNDAGRVPFRYARKELQLSALITDLWWHVDLMNSDILEKEAKAHVFDA
ncbi:hypothetical protein [Bradyrhizobium symbiodeficiens]|uniref:hypothetical protein n=1 Tax=Bradyrhizobium symbiodeficiens TaxID=1404367 RepID=UPI001FCE6BDB|nr:hypothetical protein [Bradyrhizobium symbiodeficiens]